MQDGGVDLWATDEVHFQQHGSRCQLLVPPETKDPILLHHPTRRSVGYFGAVRLGDGKFVFTRETDRFNAAAFWDFMRMLRRRSARTGRRVVVISDNAKYHHARLHKAWRECHAEDFALDYLPPYSPELNPIERVWKLTRRRCLHNRYFATLEEVIAAVESEFESRVLTAASEGATLAGPVGTTPPMLDGGEWSHLLAGGTTQPRAQGEVRFAPESLARGKERPTGCEENNHWLAAESRALRLWRVKKDADFP